MLHAVELLTPSHRRAPRRGLAMGCALTTRAAGPRRQELLDLSPKGARVRASRFDVSRDERVLIEFAPPALGRRVETLARVARVEDLGGAFDIGLEFVGLAPEIRSDLERSLRGVPPPLPSARTRAKPELVWIEMLVTWEEDLGDRVNTFEVSEVMAALDDGEIEIEALASLVTAGTPRYRWAS